MWNIVGSRSELRGLELEVGGCLAVGLRSNHHELDGVTPVAFDRITAQAFECTVAIGDCLSQIRAILAFEMHVDCFAAGKAAPGE